MTKHRLQKRQLKIWSQDYLVYRYLWPNIERAVQRAMCGTERANPIVVDLGCGHQPYRNLFRDTLYFGMDYCSEDTTPDFIGDSRKVPIKTGSVDIVFSTQVIEHVAHPDQMICECSRILRTGGHLILSGPFHWPLHEEPFDFYRFTKYGFAQLLSDAGFSSWQITEDGGDWAQLMLALSLRLNGKSTAPLRVLVNLAGALLDEVSTSKKSPSNYTVLATR